MTTPPTTLVAGVTKPSKDVAAFAALLGIPTELDAVRDPDTGLVWVVRDAATAANFAADPSSLPTEPVQGFVGKAFHPEDDGSSFVETA